MNITKRALALALKELLQKEPLAKASVGEICQRCGMNRKSFYYHFKDKYDLVNWIFYTEFLEGIFNTPSHEDGWDVTLRLCKYFEQNKAFYKRVLEVRGQNSFYEYFGDVLEESLKEVLDPYFVEGPHHAFHIMLFAEAIRSVILRWVCSDHALPADEFVELLKEATMGRGYKFLRDSCSPSAHEKTD